MHIDYSLNEIISALGVLDMFNTYVNSLGNDSITRKGISHNNM